MIHATLRAIAYLRGEPDDIRKSSLRACDRASTVMREVTVMDAATFRAAIGAGTGGGSVSSVSGTGTVNGITLTGTVTSTGSLTLGGTLSGVNLTSQVTGTLPAANGGTGNTNGTVAKLATTNFSVEESGGKLIFKYGGTTIASMDSSGNFTTLANVTAYGTP